MIKFSSTHEWAKIVDDKIAIIGITDYAQSQLGDVVFIELPTENKEFSKGQRFGTIESTKAASELYTPLSGKVVEVNKDLLDNPQWINESPYDKGWMIKIEISNPHEIETLMDKDSYEEFLKQEQH